MKYKLKLRTLGSVIRLNKKRRQHNLPKIIKEEIKEDVEIEETGEIGTKTNKMVRLR